MPASEKSKSKFHLRAKTKSLTKKIKNQIVRIKSQKRKTKKIKAKEISLLKVIKRAKKVHLQVKVARPRTRRIRTPSLPKVKKVRILMHPLVKLILLT